MTRRIIHVGGKEFFYYFMRRERRQEKYLQGRENGIFLSHGTRTKQIIERRQRIWDGLRRVYVWITEDKFARSMLFLCSQQADDTFAPFKMKIAGAWPEENRFSTMEGLKIERLLCFFFRFSS